MDLGYVAIMSSALLVGAWVRHRTVDPLPLPRLQRIGLVLGAVIGGTLGAKIPFLAMDWDGFLRGTAWLSDGRTLTFGLVGGYLGVEIAKLSMGVSIKTGDSFAVPLASAVAVGRLGCFYAGCCFGAAAPSWMPGVDFGDGVARHATQLYEAVFHALAAVALYRLGQRGRFERQRVKLYILAYCVYRFFTEMIRPEPRLALDLTLYQWATIAFVPLFGVLWWLDRDRDADLRDEDRGRA